MSEWRTIDSAPEGLDRLDLWIIPPSKFEKHLPYRNENSTAHRITDARRRLNGKAGWVSGGKFVTGKWFYDEEGEQCIDPEDTSEYAFRATYYMPPPDPPD